MEHTRILSATLRSAMQAGLSLIALVTGLGLMPGWQSTIAAQGCQQEGACFVFESQGYITNPSNGQTIIAFRVTNKCRNPASYVAIGTSGFTRVAPADGSVYNGDLGIYDVAWTRASGTPGFESVKFTPALKNFANSASETLNVVVSNFNPASMSELDISERRVPQDGRFKTRYKNRSIDFRVSRLNVRNFSLIVSLSRIRITASSP